MNKSPENFEITLPKNQLKLFGYDHYFNFFVNLYKKNKLPNVVLLTGLKGSGKATFAYHFINYLLSQNENNKYSLKEFCIHPENKTYQNICNNIHPNFSVLENDLYDEDIKIESVRSTLRFLSKSSYLSSIKIVLIDSVEFLNKHSSNALLKAIEEANDKTFFFIINSNSYKISNTIKSRCIEFNFFFSLLEKKKILNHIHNQFISDFNLDIIDEYFYFESSGNILKYLLILNEDNTALLNNKLACIYHLIDEYKQVNDPQLYSFVSLLIELFYNELAIKNNKNLNIYSLNKYNLIKQIDNAKKFNLDKKNLFISLKGALKNESK